MRRAENSSAENFSTIKSININPKFASHVRDIISTQGSDDYINQSGSIGYFGGLLQGCYNAMSAKRSNKSFAEFKSFLKDYSKHSDLTGMSRPDVLTTCINIHTGDIEKLYYIVQVALKSLENIEKYLEETAVQNTKNLSQWSEFSMKKCSDIMAGGLKKCSDKKKNISFDEFTDKSMQYMLSKIITLFIEEFKTHKISPFTLSVFEEMKKQAVNSALISQMNEEDVFYSAGSACVFSTRNTIKKESPDKFKMDLIDRGVKELIQNDRDMLERTPNFHKESEAELIYEFTYAEVLKMTLGILEATPSANPEPILENHHENLSINLVDNAASAIGDNVMSAYYTAFGS